MGLWWHSKRKHYCWCILDAHNMPQFQINACSSYNDRKTTDSGGADSMSWAKGWRSLYGRISRSSFMHVFQFSGICMRTLESFVILLCKLLAPKVLVTLLKNSGCGIFIEGCVFIESNNGNTTTVIMIVKCD